MSPMRVQIFKPLLLIQIKIVVHHFFFSKSQAMQLQCRKNLQQFFFLRFQDFL